MCRVSILSCLLLVVLFTASLGLPFLLYSVVGDDIVRHYKPRHVVKGYPMVTSMVYMDTVWCIRKVV